MKRGADWLAWSLQLIAGLAVGAFIGLRVITDGGHYHNSPSLGLATEHVSAFLWGAAFIGAAMASYMGDKLWIGSSYRIIPPDEPQNSATSRSASVLIGICGAMLILLALYCNFQPM